MFLALAAPRRNLFLLAFAQLWLARRRVLQRPFERIVADLQRQPGDHRAATLEPLQLSLAVEVGWAVRAAAPHTPWPSTCLVQALAAQRMLAQRGIAGALYLGASTEAGDTDHRQLAAHAWLKCADRFVTGEAGHERFTPLTAFSWP